MNKATSIFATVALGAVVSIPANAVTYDTIHTTAMTYAAELFDTTTPDGVHGSGNPFGTYGSATNLMHDVDGQIEAGLLIAVNGSLAGPWTMDFDFTVDQASTGNLELFSTTGIPNPGNKTLQVLVDWIGLQAGNSGSGTAVDPFVWLTQEWAQYALTGLNGINESVFFTPGGDDPDGAVQALLYPGLNADSLQDGNPVLYLLNGGAYVNHVLGEGTNLGLAFDAGVTYTIGTSSACLECAPVGHLSLTASAAATAEDDGPIAVLAQVLKPIDVLANDTGFNDPVTVTIDAPGPAEGTALVLGSPGAQADVRISYTANAGAAGSDSFTYTVDDGGSSDTATVTLTVSPPGTAGDDFATTTRNTPVDIYVGSNDVGFDDTVTVTVDNGSFTAGGSAAVTAGQGGPASGIVVLYTPSAAAGSPGYSEEFTYTIDDGVIIPVVATVTVTVDNTVPLAIEGSITSITTVGVDPSSRTGTFETPGSGGSLGDGGIVTITVNPARGTATVADATITFNPASDYFEGVDSFTYTITDADGEEASAEVSIVIANGSPGLPDSHIRTAEGAASVPLNPGILAGNGSLAQHGFAVTTQASNGTCAINPANWGRSVVYTPSGNFSGTDSCGLTVTDGDGESAMATVTITVDQLINNGYSSGSSAANPLFLSLLAGVALLYRRRQGAFRCRPDSQW